MEIILFYITIANKEAGVLLGNKAVENQIAGCANVFPIYSMFLWNSELQNVEECVLLLKTIPSKKDQLNSFILKHHPYDVPCVMNWSVMVNKEYGEWIEQMVNNP